MKLIAGAGLVLLGAMGCATGEPGAGDGAAEGRIPAPTIRIVSPGDGSSTGPEVEVRLESSGIAIVPASGLREPGEAHYHLYLDADPSSDRTQPIGQGAGVLHLGTGADTHTFQDLAPGPHRLIAVLGWGDHVPVADAPADTVTFSVEGATPRP